MPCSQGGLDPDHLKTHCPLAWNTPERGDTYAKLGFDMLGEASRLISESLGGDGAIKPGVLPVRLMIAYAVVGTRGPADIRVAKRQDTDIEPWGERTVCGPSEDKPTLTAKYLHEHAPTRWDEESMRDAYATLGYAIEREIVHGLIEKPADGDETVRHAAVTIDTTWTAGGCLIACAGGNCCHKHVNLA